MSDVPVTASSLRAYIDLREQDLMAEAISTIKHGFGPEFSEDATDWLHAQWNRLRELYKLRLLMFGDPVPSLEDWREALANELLRTDGLWGERRRDFVRQRWEMMDRAALDTTSPTYTGYRATLAANTTKR